MKSKCYLQTELLLLDREVIPVWDSPSGSPRLRICLRVWRKSLLMALYMKKFMAGLQLIMRLETRITI